MPIIVAGVDKAIRIAAFLDSPQLRHALDDPVVRDRAFMLLPVAYSMYHNLRTQSALSLVYIDCTSRDNKCVFKAELFFWLRMLEMYGKQDGAAYYCTNDGWGPRTCDVSELLL